jgi:hypothetical protein
MSSLIAATRHHPSLDGTLLSARCVHDLADCVKSTAVISSQEIDEDVELFATESDVVRVFRNVVAHRLRVRDGPGDEILGSLVRSAVFRHDETEEARGRATVQAVLQEILAEV